MKIDTEGSELRVLEGARRTLAAPRWRSVLTEIGACETAAPFERLLDAYGFRPAETFRRTRKGVSYILFVSEPVRRRPATRCSRLAAGVARREEHAPERRRQRAPLRRVPRRSLARAAEFAAWIALAASVAVVAAFDAITEAIEDHNDFGDVDHVVQAAAWLALAAWAAARGFSSLPSRYERIRRWSVAALLLAACPFPAIVQDGSGYAVNAVLLAVALLLPIAQLAHHRRLRRSAARRLDR